MRLSVPRLGPCIHRPRPETASQVELAKRSVAVETAVGVRMDQERTSISGIVPGLATNRDSRLARGAMMPV